MWLHRVYQVGGRWAGRAVLNSHDGFDAHLTTGWNLALAQELGWQELDRVNLGRARLLLARPPEASWGELLGTFTRTFGGVERVLTPATLDRPVVALANAMRPELLTEAYERGATTYVTGQFRPGARDRADVLGVGVVALGHRRSELWGLARLARELGGAFPDVTPVVFAGPVPST
jgi:putative NIF3 family GTP cyclohydrolase 1 type 2